MTPGQHTDHKVTFNCISFLQVDEREAEYVDIGLLDVMRMGCLPRNYRATTEESVNSCYMEKKTSYVLTLT